MVPLPSIQGGGYLNGIDGTSGGDVWAVGNSRNFYAHPVVAHWNGRKWTVSVQTQINGSLSAVATISANDAWGVGLYYDPHRTLIEHWNGSGWKVVDSPSPGTNFNAFTGVAAISSTDVWAVGWYGIPRQDVSLFAHWDGTSWLQVDGPQTPYLSAVAASSPDDIWAVGYKAAHIGFNTDPMIDHWDGTAWTEVDVELPPNGLNTLDGVSATSSTDAWAVGNTSTAALIEHWDGTAWHIVSGVPEVASLRAVSGASPTDVWAVGGGNNEAGSEHWDGASWSYVPAVTPGDSSAFYDVVAIHSIDIWAVGTYGPALSEHSEGVCP